MKIISLFSGAGGLDIGFHKAGFQTIWANEYDKKIHPSYRNYFKDVILDTRSIREVKAEDLPKEEITGLIGGPPCQSWSQAGARRGIEDPRGELFYEYIRIIKITNPKFFVAENVPGLLQTKNKKVFENLLDMFRKLGYELSWKLVNSSDYGVPQDRKRVIVVGYRKNLERVYTFPEPILKKVTLKDAIWDLNKIRIGSKEAEIKDHRLVVQSGSGQSQYSPIFLSRNRVRGWDQQSFTILATDRHIPFHPTAPRMEKVKKDVMRLAKGKEKLYRRLTVRECARIQTFPDSYKFICENPRDGYKMVGNAVPAKLAYHIANQIAADLKAIG
jgi:DNA (cytosine-5)-methyltransferase 1